MFPEKYLASEEISLVPEAPVRGGAEKKVYKVIYQNKYCAAKIFRDYYDSSNDPIDRETSAEAEFKAYKILYSRLKPYLPEPIKLLQDQGKSIGLLVEWRDGEALTNLRHFLYLQNKEFDLLEERLLSLPENLYLNTDNYNEYNICYHPNTGLWLAECLIETDPNMNKHYSERIMKETTCLKRDYVESFPASQHKT